MKLAILPLAFALIITSACHESSATASAEHAEHADHDHQKAAATDKAPATPSPAVAATGVKPYPLDTCLVSGEKLGEMGDPVVINYQGQEIKFCCKSCVPKFNKNPDKYLGKLSGK